jgi:ribonuclease P protein component
MRKERLTKTNEFAAVYQHGDSQVNRFLVMRSIPNGLDITRFGFIASKRVGNAVARNRVKRLLRESLRHTPVEPGRDIVLIARSPACAADYHSLRAAAHQLLRRARLLGESRKEEW